MSDDQEFRRIHQRLDQIESMVHRYKAAQKIVLTRLDKAENQAAAVMAALKEAQCQTPCENSGDESVSPSPPEEQSKPTNEPSAVDTGPTAASLAAWNKK